MTDTHSDIVVLGYAAFDHLFEIQDFPQPGTKCSIRNERFECGGQAATAAAAIARWGCRTRFVGRVGDDEAGKISVESLSALGVVTDSALVTKDVPTQYAYIFTDTTSGERTIFWNRHEQLNLRPSDLDRRWFQNARVLLIDGHEPAADIQAARWLREQSGIVILDAETIGPGRDTLLSLTDICFASSDFGRHEFSESDPAVVISLLRDHGVKIAGMTLGNQGAIADWGNGLKKFPPLPVQAIDTTGAGDIFHAALAYASLHLFPVEEMIRFANVAAGLSCRFRGGREGIPSLTDIQKHMNP